TSWRGSFDMDPRCLAMIQIIIIGAACFLQRVGKIRHVLEHVGVVDGLGEHLDCRGEPSGVEDSGAKSVLRRPAVRKARIPEPNSSFCNAKISSKVTTTHQIDTDDKTDAEAKKSACGR